MTAHLLERDGELELFDSVLAAAAQGEGSVVLVSGEAGIGKSSLIRGFARRTRGRALLSGACDDLLTPRTLGPIRDAFLGRSSPLDSVITAGSRDDLLTGVLAELTDPEQPTVVVIEDIHWADDATLDVLRYVSRRIDDIAVVLVISFRDDEVGPDHPAQRLLGGLGGAPAHRLRLPRLSRAGVATLSGGTGATSAALYQMTGGNPFYVSEVVAAGEHSSVPLTIVDAVLARVHRLEPATQAALEHLAVVPSRVELPLARALLGDLAVLAEAERRGILEVRSDAIAFRHELARRAVEDSLPVTARMSLNAAVLAELDRDGIDLPRALHHAVEAADDATVVALAPKAAARAAQAGSYTQEVTYYRLLLDREHLLSTAEIADIKQQLSAALFAVGDHVESLAQGLASVRLREQLGDEAALGAALIMLGPAHWVLAHTDEALASSLRSVELLRSVPETPLRAFALLYHALLLTAVGHADEAVAAAEEATASAERTAVADLVAMSRTCLGRARLLVGEVDTGLELMRDGLAATREVGAHTFVIMTYVLLVQDLYDLGRFAESQHYVDEGLVYANEREVWFYVEHLRAYGYRLQAMRGGWDVAIPGLRELVGSRTEGEKGSLRYALAPLARLLARAGAQDSSAMLAWARDYAERAACYSDLLATGLAEIEIAWLTDRPADAAPAIERLEHLTAQAGRAVERGELNRWKRRLGLPAEVPAGCPKRFAAGIEGDWRAAADEWAALDAPYQRALELLESGGVEPTLRALQIFDSLGARPAAQLTRQRLRALGLMQIPRGPQPATRTNPVGLTERQLEILRLLARGRTNAEIAADLVVSVRTVDHHVSAVLQKLDASSRRHAVRAARGLGIALD